MKYILVRWQILRKHPVQYSFLLLFLITIQLVLYSSIYMIQTANTLQLGIKKHLPFIASTYYDYHMLESPEDDIAPLNENTITKIGSLPAVKYYDYSTSFTLQSKDIKTLQDPVTKEETYLQFTGVQYPNIITMQEGKIKLTSGRVFSEDDITGKRHYLIISDTLAKKNNLHVGSRITAFQQIRDFPEDDSITNYQLDDIPILDTLSYPFEVIGIFTTIDPQQSPIWSDMMVNTVYMPNSLSTTIQKEIIAKYKNMHKPIAGTQNSHYYPLFVLQKPQAWKTFKKQANAFLPTGYKMISTHDILRYHSLALPEIAATSSIIFYTWLPLSISILILILFLYHRKIDPTEKRQNIYSLSLLAVFSTLITTAITPFINIHSYNYLVTHCIDANAIAYNETTLYPYINDFLSFITSPTTVTNRFVYLFYISLVIGTTLFIYILFIVLNKVKKV